MSNDHAAISGHSTPGYLPCAARNALQGTIMLAGASLVLGCLLMFADQVLGDHKSTVKSGWELRSALLLIIIAVVGAITGFCSTRTLRHRRLTRFLMPVIAAIGSGLAAWFYFSWDFLSVVLNTNANKEQPGSLLGFVLAAGLSSGAAVAYWSESPRLKWKHPRPTLSPSLFEFWRTTWSAWSAGKLDGLSPAYANAAKCDLPAFLETKTNRDAKNLATIEFFNRYAPQPGEFLIVFGTDGVLTSQRLWLRMNDTPEFFLAGLSLLRQYHLDDSGSLLSVSVETADGAIRSAVKNAPTELAVQIALHLRDEVPA